MVCWDFSFLHIWHSELSGLDAMWLAALESRVLIDMCHFWHISSQSSSYIIQPLPSPAGTGPDNADSEGDMSGVSRPQHRTVRQIKVSGEGFCECDWCVMYRALTVGEVMRVTSEKSEESFLHGYARTSGHFHILTFTSFSTLTQNVQWLSRSSALLLLYKDSFHTLITSKSAFGILLVSI